MLDARKIPDIFTSIKSFLIINNADGNDSFEVLAENADEAAHKALETLEWWVSEGEPLEETEDEVA